jgi:hypothetical protein
MVNSLKNRNVRLKRWEFPNYWEELVEPVASGKQVVARLKGLVAAIDLADAEGATFFLQDENGDALEVHCGGDEWAVAFFPREGKPVM